MPAPTVMRLRGKQLDKTISTSPSDREKKKEAKKKDDDSRAISPWVMALLIFALLGSAVLNIFINIQNSPSMSDPH